MGVCVKDNKGLCYIPIIFIYSMFILIIFLNVEKCAPSKQGTDIINLIIRCKSKYKEI